MAADDNLRDLFNEVAPPPEPSSAQRERARAQLRDEFRASPKSTPRWWQQPAAAVAGAAVVALVIVGALVLPTSAPSVDANLANIAAAARTVPAQELPEGSYVYARTESLTIAHEPPPFGPGVFYLLPETIEVWAQGDSMLETRLVTRPQFSTTEDEEQYYALGADITDRVGEVVTTSMTGAQNQVEIAGLSTDLDELREQIYEELGQDPEWSPADEARTFNFIVQLMLPRLNSPSMLRAALIELVGSLDVTTERLPGGSVMASIEYEQEGLGRVLDVVEFDAAGYLVTYRSTVLTTAPGVEAPAGLWSELIFSRPAVVDAPGLPPGR